MALARALAPNPDVILLDEPFSTLDASLRERVRRDLRDILQEAHATAVFVTHDQEDALAPSDMVAVMRGGRVIQAATPQELYASPVVVDREFFGHDQMISVCLPGGTQLRARTVPSSADAPGQRVWVKVGNVTTFPT